jgi:hypothetical protein
VPIVDFNGANGSAQVQIKGFAELWITSVDGGGNISCEFIDQVTLGNSPGPAAVLYGALSVMLLNSVRRAISGTSSPLALGSA